MNEVTGKLAQELLRRTSPDIAGQVGAGIDVKIVLGSRVKKSMPTPRRDRSKIFRLHLLCKTMRPRSTAGLAPLDTVVAWNVEWN